MKKKLSFMSDNWPKDLAKGNQIITTYITIRHFLEKKKNGKERPEDIWNEKKLGIMPDKWPEDLYEEKKSYEELNLPEDIFTK